ncbi:MAG: histidine kinase, partial [Bacteroidota bacterium]
LQYLSKFALLMRTVLANAQETKVAVANEIQLLEHYLSIQQLRFEHLFEFEIEMAPNVLTWKTLIPPFLLQPFIEMAIEQGQFDKMKNAWIKIDIKKEKELILLSITDNGQPRFSQLTNEKDASAIAMTQKRLRIINKLWHKPIQFEIIESSQSLVKTVFTIPI